MQCPACGAEDQESWKYCESCGTVLQIDAVAESVSETATAADAAPEQISISVTVVRCRCGAAPELRDAYGYCSVCGLKATPAHKPDDPADHREIVLAPHFAAVTDRGKRHPTNQDDMAVALETIDGSPVYVIVVCDGLSSSCAAEAASAAASKTACTALVAGASTGPAEMNAVMMDAILEAHKAVCAIPFTADPVKDGPATTIVAAIVKGKQAAIGWVGDSRAYMLTSEGAGASLLSHDDSWVNEMVDDGEMSMEEAMKSPEAHVITQCLGPMTDDDGSPAAPPKPTVRTVSLPSSGCLLLCSDGVWNFVEQAEQIVAKLAEHAEIDTTKDALSIARCLVQYANSCGGRDNITAAALCLEDERS